MDESDDEVARLLRQARDAFDLSHFQEALWLTDQLSTLLTPLATEASPQTASSLAKVWVIRANCLNAVGRGQEALIAYGLAHDFFAQADLLNRGQFDHDLAKLALKQGNCLKSLGLLPEALTSYDTCEEILIQSRLIAEIDLVTTRAKLALNRGSCLKGLGLSSEALTTYRQARDFLTLPLLAERAELDRTRSKLALNEGICLQSLGRGAKALLAYDEAMGILARPHMKARADLDPTRARLALNRGVCYENLGLRTQAMAAYDEARSTLSGPNLINRSDLDTTRSRLSMNRGICLHFLGRLTEALASYDEAQDILTRPNLSIRPELDTTRAKLAMNRGLSLRSLGRMAEAMTTYQEAQSILVRPHLLGCADMDTTRAKVAMNRGLCLRSLGFLTDALIALDETRSILARPPLSDRTEMDTTRAKLAMNRGLCLYALNRQTEAFEAYDEATAILTNPSLADRAEMDTLRAKLAINRGVLFTSLGQKSDAIHAFEEARKVLAGLHLAEPKELEGMRALLAMNWGIYLYSDGQRSQALCSHQLAEHYWLNMTHLPLPRRVTFGKNCHFMSSLLPEMGSSSQSWALSSSDRLIEMLDLDPRGNVAPWPELRGHFASFHVNWLRHCLSGGPEDRAMVPRVLNALQGRRLAAEVIEAALAAGDADPAIKAYAGLKGEMRDILRQIEAAEGRGLGAFDTGNGPGGEGGSGLRGFESFGGLGGSLAGGFELRRDEGLLERLRGEFRAKETKLAAKRDAVSQLPGFEVLGQPLGKMSMEALQGVLAPGEALVLALPLEREAKQKPTTGAADGTSDPAGFETRLWVLRASGTPEVITLPEGICAQTTAQGEGAAPAWEVSLFGIGQTFAAFNAMQSGRGGMRRGGWGQAEDATAETGVEGAAPVLRGKTALPPGVVTADVWPQMASAMERLFWQPLRASEALAGTSDLLLATTGPLHNLPFAAGRREGKDPTLWQVNSLVTWALGRGLYHTGGVETETPTGTARPATDEAARLPVGLLYDPASTNIPLASAEVALAAHLWQEVTPERGVITDTAHPWQPAKPVRFVHLACHGSIDTRSGETPRPVIGLTNRKADHADDPAARVVTERHLLAGPPAAEVLMNLCVGGQSYDDLLDGDPTGLIAAWMRHGAHTVVAALPPVPDGLGAIFGTIVTLLMTDPNAPMSLAEAARLAARILGEDPGLASPQLASRLAPLLPRLTAPVVVEAIEMGLKLRQSGPEALAATMAIKDLLDARPATLWWLPDAACTVLRTLPRSGGHVPCAEDIIAALAPFVPEPIHDGLRAVFPDPTINPVAAQTIRYGYAVFGDPRRHSTI